ERVPYRRRAQRVGSQGRRHPEAQRRRQGQEGQVRREEGQGLTRRGAAIPRDAGAERAMIGRMEIWLNPACSKCKAATVALDGSGEIYTVRRYLEAPPTHEELEAVLARLGMEPWDL